MESVLFIFGVVACLYLIFTLVELIFGFYKIKNLSDQTVMEENQLPSLSIIFSALNEERDIENALLTMINLNYPRLEIIAINDRSKDKTPEILDRLQKQYPILLKVCHINELPQGWFGKNHALHLGSQIAKGDWLLFTDADVNMKENTLLKSMSYVLENRLDHLTIYENHNRNNFWLRVSLLGIYLAYSVHRKPWRMRYSWSKKSVGHGAFNLVRKTAYFECGGHAAIAMECLDDLKLGEIIKQRGFSQDVVDGRDFVSRDWYTSLPDMVNGIKKNSFAYYNYRIFPTCRDAILLILFYIWPLIAVCCFNGPVFSVNLLNIFLTVLISACVAKQFRLKKWFAFFYPVGLSVLIYTIFNSLISICQNDGVIWRGTYYSLESIRNNKV